MIFVNGLHLSFHDFMDPELIAGLALKCTWYQPAPFALGKGASRWDIMLFFNRSEVLRLIRLRYLYFAACI